MNEFSTSLLARLCGALANERRVEIFHHLLATPGTGRTFGDIATKTGIPPSSLTHHLKEMQAGGLLLRLRRADGVRTIFTLDLALLNQVFSQLLTQCCSDQPTRK